MSLGFITSDHLNHDQHHGHCDGEVSELFLSSSISRVSNEGVPKPSAREKKLTRKRQLSESVSKT